MSSSKTSYRQIMKATSIFGGVQFFGIIISIIRSKFVALLIGPSGMGIYGLLENTTGLIASITNFGLGTSAVKNIAEANETNDSYKTGRIIAILRKLVWLTGLLGSCIVFFSASWLSQFTFGNQDFTLSFRWLSITLLLNQISTGQLVLLQGMRQIKLLAKASLSGSFIGLIVAIPVYYRYGVDGIVPVMILISGFSLLLSNYYSKKIKINKVTVSLNEVFSDGKSMLVMGFFIGLTGIMDQAIAYITRIFISNYGSVELVGLYSAGFAIVNTYVGLVFSAMLKDYYPRLSGIANDKVKASDAMNQQAEIALLILAPLVILFLIFIKQIIIILYSITFLSIDGMIYWAMVGVLLKAVNWSLGIIVLARGDSKLYFITYIFATFICLTTNIGGFYLWGLEGLGVAFLISNLLLSILGYYIARRFYSFSLSFDLIKVFTILFTLAVICFIFVRYIDTSFNYFIYAVLVFVTFWFSYRELDKRLDLKVIVLKVINKRK